MNMKRNTLKTTVNPDAAPDGRGGVRRWRRAAVLPVAALAVVGVAGLVPSPAYAASGVSVSGGSLKVTAQAGKANKFNIRLAANVFTVIDGGDSVTPGAGCTAVAANKVTCGAVGISSVVVDSGDGDDVIDARTTIRATANAGSGNDQILGSSNRDVLDRGDGSDNLSGFDGADTLNGGIGNDSLNGGASRDIMDGGLGADTFVGGDDIDEVSYASRTATVRVDPDDVADDGQAGEGDNVRGDVEDISGGAGDDMLFGNAAANRLVGRAGLDTLRGLAGNDRLFGGDGNDVMFGDDGDDDLDGQAGSDSFFGGAGRDEALYNSATAGVRVDLDNVADDGQTGEADNVRSDIEDLSGSPFNDLLNGSSVSNRLNGRGGIDTLIGNDGDDTLFGDIGDDRLNGGKGTDSLFGGSGNDQLAGGDGADSLFGDSGNDFLSGAQGCVSCGNDGLADELFGGPDIDTVEYLDHGLGVTVTIDGVANDGNENEGDNVITDVENVTGTLISSDTISGSNQANILDGLGGNDSLVGLSGDDRLFCGAGTGDSANGGDGSFDTADSCETVIGVP